MWVNRTTSLDSWLNSSAWCVAMGPDAMTPIAWSRTSQPWQYGQWMTWSPHSSRTPGTSGSSSTSPVVTSRRRAATVSPPASVSTKASGPSATTPTTRSSTSRAP